MNHRVLDILECKLYLEAPEDEKQKELLYMKKWMISCITLLLLLAFSGVLAEKQQAVLIKELQTLVHETGKFDKFTILTADEDTLSGHPTEMSVFVLEAEDYCVLFIAKETENEWKIRNNMKQQLLFPKEL